MVVQIIVDIKSARFGKNKNWIIFEAFCGFFDNNKKYTIEYCGTDVETNIPFTDSQGQQLIEKLHQEYGYAPFALDSIKKKIVLGQNITIIK